MMSNSLVLPSDKDLTQLPLASIKTYALRCALRSQPLWTAWNDPTFEYKKSVVNLKVSFDKLLSNLTDPLQDLNSVIIAASVAANAANVATTEASKAANDAYVASEDRFDNIRAAAKATLAATLASTLIGTSSSRSTIPQSAIAAFRASQEAAESFTALEFNRSSFIDFVRLAKSDYEKLMRIGYEVSDLSATGPLGDLWKKKSSSWYKKAVTDFLLTIDIWKKEIIVEQGLSTTETAMRGEENILSVYIDPGDAPAELITDLYIALDALYRAHGGSGLEIIKEERRSLAGELI